METIMEQVTKNIYTETKIRGCNPTVVFTTEGVVFIDNAQLITPLMETIEFAKERGPIKYLINTEPHIDHIFGNHWFKDEAITIGHNSLEKELWLVPGELDAYDYSVDVLTRQDPEGLALMPPRGEYHMMKRPDITFDGHMTVSLGNTTFELYHTPGHAISQICVHIPEERVVIVGDTIFSEVQTWLHSADIGALLDTLDFLETLDVDYVIPGHGPVVSKDYIATQRDFVLEWISAVERGIEMGWSPEECVENIEFKSRYPMDIGQPEMMDYVQRTNVLKCYDYIKHRQ